MRRSAIASNSKAPKRPSRAKKCQKSLGILVRSQSIFTEQLELLERLEIITSFGHSLSLTFQSRTFKCCLKHLLFLGWLTSRGRRLSEDHKLRKLYGIIRPFLHLVAQKIQIYSLPLPFGSYILQSSILLFTFL